MSPSRARWPAIPQIMLADEPTAALDSHTGRNVMEMMSELAHQRGRAVVIVTHDSRVLEFADRTMRIEDGLIAQPDRQKSRAEMSAELRQPAVCSARRSIAH